MEVSALASGSSGNCFYIADEDSAILIDAGISAKQAISRLLEIGGNPGKIKAIFITHEHSDHIRGCDVLARKLKIPVFATKATVQKGFLCSNKNLIHFIGKNTILKIGNLKIESFSKSHSAADPVSFNIYANKKVSVITDAGHACNNIKKHVSNCNFLFIESNHDEEMLENGPYPIYLKKWIKGDEGHLSNSQAATCVKKHASIKLKKIILSHLSKNNNTPEIALSTFNQILKTRSNFFPEIDVSVREYPTKLFRI